jgi:protein-disulfide isomerase
VNGPGGAALSCRKMVAMKLWALVLAASLPVFAASAGIAKGKGFGNPAAPILIEVYTDFECPGCRAFHTDFLPLLMRDYVDAGKVYLVAHDISFHAHSSEATGYAMAAARIGKYREVADALFQHQTEWSANGKVWDAVAVALSPADQKKVTKLAKDPSVLAEVKTETDDGRTKIHITPTMVVTHAMKEHRFEGKAIAWDIFRDWLNELLKK